MTPVSDVSSYADYLRKTYGDNVANNYLSLHQKSQKTGYKYRNKQGLLVVVWEDQHKTLTEWSEILGISRWTFIDRLKDFGVTERTFCPKGQRSVDIRNRKLTFKRKTMTALEWSKFLKVSWWTFYQRLRRYDETDPRLFAPGNLHWGARYKKSKGEV